MATLYEYYITGDDHTANIGLVNWEGQTFTPEIAHTITSVKLKLWRVGSPGIITVSIRATDGSGLPTSPDLCSGTTSGNTLATGAPYTWREISLGDGAPLAAFTKYAICIRALSAVLWTDYLNIRCDSSAISPVPSYDEGGRIYSSNSGVSWIEPTAPATYWDQMFEDWGVPTVPAPTVTTNPATAIR